MVLEALTAAFILAFLSEIADKTQLVILGLALKYKSPFKVFIGALGAHAIMDGVAIIIGAFVGFSLPSNIIKGFIASIFIILGLFEFYKLFIKKTKKDQKKVQSKNPLTASFLIILVSEFGDKTQIASGLLSAKFLEPISIFIGTTIALAIVIGLNVFIGSKIAEKIPRKSLKIFTATLFIIFGILTILF